MSRFAYVAVLTLLGIGCAAGVKPAQTGTGGTGAVASGVAGTTGSGGTTGTAAGTGTGATGAGGSSTPNPDAGACQQFDVMFTPKTPTVYVLVDRSGSEFLNAMSGPYFTLRDAVLQVVQELQGQVRFGFGAFVGDHATGTCQNNPQSVPIDINNYAAISAKYTSLGPLLPYGSKADTPAAAMFPMVKQALQADTGNGQKYVLFVTDSETDFCDDGGALCPADAVTYQIQDMFASTPSIGTLVIGLPTAMTQIATGVLQNFANAGVGQPVVNPAGSGAATLQDIYYQCQGAGSGQWMSMYTSAGRTGNVPLATYGTTAGTATVYAPTSTAKQALVDQISAALANVKSCTFDLGGHIKVSLTKLAKATVKVNGAVVPLDATNANGWDMTSDTVLQLFGPACDNWRDPNVNDIKFDFPCDIIIN